MLYNLQAQLAGSTFCDGQTYLANLADSEGKEVFHLVRDRYNRFDRNAVKIVGTSINKGMYGFISKKNVETVARCMDCGGTVTITGYNIIGGGYKLNYGLFINITLEYPKKGGFRNVQ